MSTTCCTIYDLQCRVGFTRAWVRSIGLVLLWLGNTEIYHAMDDAAFWVFLGAARPRTYRRAGFRLIEKGGGVIHSAKLCSADSAGVYLLFTAVIDILD